MSDPSPVEGTRAERVPTRSSRVALTRAVPASLELGERTFIERGPIDLERAMSQHAAYRRRLSQLGLEVEMLPAEPALPDSVFVEDCAVVLDELAVLARPGAPSRRAELDDVAGWLEGRRPLIRIGDPATLDGGDVLRVERTLFVGRSSRTNEAGIEQLRAAVAGHGYEVIPVALGECLHLKSACSWIGGRRVLVNRELLDTEPLAGLTMVDVARDEPLAADVLYFPDRSTVLAASEYPATAERIRAAGRAVVTTELSEFLKAEAAASCLSLIL